MSVINPLEIVLIKEDKNSYFGGMKWINSEIFEYTSRTKKEFFHNLFNSISDFFPETYIDPKEAKKNWDFYNPDIPYELGLTYLKPFWDIIKETDLNKLSEKTIPIVIYDNFEVLSEPGASHWSTDDFYWEIIRNRFGVEETKDWSFTDDEFIKLFHEEKLKLPPNELLEKTKLDWLIEKKIISK